MERTANCLAKLDRMNKTLRHQEADRVPISDFFWGAFLERWREELGLPADAWGVVVTKIRPDSVAARADEANRLLPGDVIVRIDWWRERRTIRNQLAFRKVMEELRDTPPPYVQFVILTKEGYFRVAFAVPGRS